MKNYILAIIGVIIIFVGLNLMFSIDKSPLNLKGIESTNFYYYTSATNSTVVCNGATSTAVLAASSPEQRMNFELTVASSTNITLCKSATGCVVGSGLTINASGGNYEQTDVYYGAYSCIGNGASSTVGITYKQ